MFVAFEGYKDSNAKEVDGVPARWDDEQLVYELCGDDVTKREYVLDNVTYRQALKWFLHRRYSDYAQRKATEK